MTKTQKKKLLKEHIGKDALLISERGNIVKRRLITEESIITISTWENCNCTPHGMSSSAMASSDEKVL